jgi:hypothetical protein
LTPNIKLEFFLFCSRTQLSKHPDNHQRQKTCRHGGKQEPLRDRQTYGKHQSNANRENQSTHADDWIASIRGPGCHPASPLDCFFMRTFKAISGGADRDRTGGLLVANQALSQLSYSPFFRRSAFSHHIFLTADS